eukprot:g62993.t1
MLAMMVWFVVEPVDEILFKIIRKVFDRTLREIPYPPRKKWQKSSAFRKSSPNIWTTILHLSAERPCHITSMGARQSSTINPIYNHSDVLQELKCCAVLCLYRSLAFYEIIENLDFKFPYHSCSNALWPLICFAFLSTFSLLHLQPLGCCFYLHNF